MRRTADDPPLLSATSVSIGSGETNPPTMICRRQRAQGTQCENIKQSVGTQEEAAFARGAYEDSVLRENHMTSGDVRGVTYILPRQSLEHRQRCGPTVVMYEVCGTREKMKGGKSFTVKSQNQKEEIRCARRAKEAAHPQRRGTT